MTSEPIVLERILDAPLEKVWKALTDKDQMKQWYFDLAEFKPERGFEFRFQVENDGAQWVHLCRITEVIPYRKISYTWKYEGYGGESTVSFELFPEGDQTRLRLVHDGIDSFPSDVPALAKKNFEEGWNEIVGVSLKEFVETGHINHSFDVKAGAKQAWQLFVNNDLLKQWASAFSAGTYAETDWKKGSEVIWKDATGAGGAKGVVVDLEEEKMIRVAYYDDINAKPGDSLGKYMEIYQLTEKDGVTTVTIDCGPLLAKHLKVHEPLWDEAIKRMKNLAETAFAK